MNLIDESKMDKIVGGGIPPVWICIIVATACVFLAGVIDGITNPEKCN